MKKAELPPKPGSGADMGTRTPNLLITNQPLYRLSYNSMTKDGAVGI